MIFHDEKSDIYLWLHTHADKWFWYISPEVGSTYGGSYVAGIESPQVCPNNTQNWLMWKMQLLIGGKWVSEGTLATCKLDPAWSIWTSWSNCMHRDCSQPEKRRRFRTCENDPTLSCPGEGFEESLCGEDCKEVRALCCESVDLKSEDKYLTGRFELEFFMLGKPVYRHVESIDVFLYNNGTNWNIGKGLLSGLIYMTSTDADSFCPSEVDSWSSGSELSCSGFKEDSDQGQCCDRIFASFQSVGRDYHLKSFESKKFYSSSLNQEYAIWSKR